MAAAGQQGQKGAGCGGKKTEADGKKYSPEIGLENSYGIAYYTTRGKPAEKTA